jgi:hypothetical protein
MVVSNNFAKVREAFSANVTESLRRLQVQVKATTPKGDWLQIACPLCPDKSGSASISAKSGYLRCHQCGAKADLFTWVGQSIGCTKPWEQCQKLAALFGVTVEGVERSKTIHRVVPEISPETFADFHHRLFSDDDQEMVREFLRRRKLWDPELLESMPIAAFGGKLLFIQYDVNGKLMKRAKVYNPFPLNDEPKWTWNKIKGQTGRTVSFWPFNETIQKMDPGCKQLICEGEWDALSAIVRLHALEKGTLVSTWTGGGGAPIPADSIPEHMRRRETHIVYDNDVFQGPDNDVAPDDKKLAELRQRKKNLIEQVGPSFTANGCKVFLRAITIPPLTQWGADLRDMIDAGLESFEELPSYQLQDCRKALLQPKKVEFHAVHKHLNQYIEFRCQVAGIHDEVQIKQHRTALQCEMGQHSYCGQCKAPEIAPNGIIDFTAIQAQLAAAMTDNHVQRHIMDRIIGKPNSCRRWQLSPVDSSDGSRWSAMALEDDEKEGTRTVEILSDAQPPLAGELLVRGWLYISANGLTPVLMCDHLESTDKKIVDITPHKASFLHELPTKAETVEEIDGYLDRWGLDVANHTTRIYGRRDLHVTLGLVMHSALWMDVDGQRRRGWLDACMIGATRTGKSAAARAYLRAIGLGQHFTPMGNFSRAGLTLGTISLNGQSKTKPGVFPRNHGKLVVLDESHLMVQDNVGGGSLFPMLQGARDIGKVEAAKISGNQMLNAAVRLIAISNWMGGSKAFCATGAHHLLKLYGTPEALARMDFGITVDEIEQGMLAVDCENFWTPERQQSLAVRAWHILPNQIRIEPEAMEESRKLCQFKWKEKYSEELPLFTEKEKFYSVLRIAIAVANMTLSTPDGEINNCLVREVHVKWAAHWLEHTWEMLEYENVSRTARRQMIPKQSWKIEALLTVALNMSDPSSVQFVLGKLYGVLTKEELKAVTGQTWTEFETWASSMLRSGGVEIVRGDRANQLCFQFTKGAIEIVKKLTELANEAPEAWERRFFKMKYWVSGNQSGLGKIIDGPDNVLPIDMPLEHHINEQRQRRLDGSPD